MENNNQDSIVLDEEQVITHDLYQLSFAQLTELKKRFPRTSAEQKIERVIDEYRKANIYNPLRGRSIFQLSSLANKVGGAPALLEMNVWGDENSSLVESLCGKPGAYLDSSYQKLKKGDKNLYILGFLAKQHRDLSDFLLERLSFEEIKRLRLIDDALVTDPLAHNPNPNLEQ